MQNNCDVTIYFLIFRDLLLNIKILYGKLIIRTPVGEGDYSNNSSFTDTNEGVASGFAIHFY